MSFIVLGIIAVATTIAAALLGAPAPVLAPPTETPTLLATSTDVVATELEPASVAEEEFVTPEPDVSAPTEEEPAEQSGPVPTPEPSPNTGPTDAELNSLARGSLVNIFCTTRSGGETRPLSGTGIIISDTGVVLTNAHIAQYFLLRNYPRKDNLQCTLRMGSPAVEKYEASLLYIPSDWVEENAEQIDDKIQKGTGENDFAFLVITSAVYGELPGTYPALTPKSATPKVDERMLLAAYPAGFLSGETISENLYPTSAFGTVKKRYTFEDPKQTDLFSIGGSVVSQSGSSGGAAVRTDGTLAGLIATAVLEGSTGERELRSITIAHINRALAAQGKGSLSELISGNVVSKAYTFEEDVAPGLTELLESELRN